MNSSVASDIRKVASLATIGISYVTEINKRSWELSSKTYLIRLDDLLDS